MYHVWCVHHGKANASPSRVNLPSKLLFYNALSSLALSCLVLPCLPRTNQEFLGITALPHPSMPSNVCTPISDLGAHPEPWPQPSRSFVSLGRLDGATLTLGRGDACHVRLDNLKLLTMVSRVQQGARDALHRARSPCQSYQECHIVGDDSAAVH